MPCCGVSVKGIIRSLSLLLLFFINFYFIFIFSKLVNQLPFVYFEIEIFGAVIVVSFKIALALRNANFVSRNIGR